MSDPMSLYLSGHGTECLHKTQDVWQGSDLSTGPGQGQSWTGAGQEQGAFQQGGLCEGSTRMSIYTAGDCVSGWGQSKQ